MGNHQYFDASKLRHCGKNVIIAPSVVITSPEKVSIGDNTVIDHFVRITGDVSIGAYSHISSQCVFVGGVGKATIGNFVDFAPGCKIVLASNNYHGDNGLLFHNVPEEYRGTPQTGLVTIDDYALFGCDTVILPGTAVPEGMATGALTLIQPRKDNYSYKPWTLYAGNPARKIGARDGTIMKRYGTDLLAKLRGE